MSVVNTRINGFRSWYGSPAESSTVAGAPDDLANMTGSCLVRMSQI